MKKPLYFDDITPGQQFESNSYAISKEDAIIFARQYDPQYFHVDEEAAKDSVFGKLVVSGWQTAAISMRLKADSELGGIKGGLIGLGLESVAWPLPVYPGDSLRLVITIMETCLSASKPTHGIIKYKMETFNQHGALVMRAITAVLAQRRTLSS